MPVRKLLVVLSIVLAGSCAARPLQGGDVDLPPRSDPAGFSTLLELRVSTRTYTGEPLDSLDVADILWAGCGALPDGRMTVPSAGAVYPLVLYLVAGSIEGIDPGVYAYDPGEAVLLLSAPGDARHDLSAACLGQPWVASAPLSVVICAEPGLTARRYGERGSTYVAMEAGHSSQNIYLMCAALGLGTVAVGAFDDPAVSSVLGLGEGLVPLYVMPVGHPAPGVEP